MEPLTPVLLGALTGLLLGLTGAGGGILAAPSLILLMHQSVTDAAPISLIAVSLGAGLGAYLGLREGIVRYRAALLLSVMGLTSSPLGIEAARRLPNTPLVLFFSFLLFYQAWRYWGASKLHRDQHFPCRTDPVTGRFVWTRLCGWTMVRMGLLTGFLSGLLGVGGGFILVPALRRHTPLSMHSISATSLMVLTIVSAGGLLQWLVVGRMNWQIGTPFLFGALAGMFVGRELTHKIEELHMRRAFSLLCFAVAVSLVLKVALRSG